MPFENEFDVVFSNAVFHWISDHSTLLKNIHKVLKAQGVLVCVFGANGNIATIEDAFEKVEELTRGVLWNGAEWVADYRRLRAIAHT